MVNDRIELQIIHEPAIHKTDNGFAIRILINEHDTMPTELTQEQLLKIGSILLNTSNKFINTIKL